MAEPIDPLEQELASFRPRAVSLELRERIGAELTRRPMWASVSLAALAAAACVAIAVGIWANRPTTKYVNTPPERPFENMNPVRTATVASPPTVMDYRRALGESSAAFDALLARPAGRGRGEQPAPLGSFMRSETDFNTDNGDSL